MLKLSNYLLNTLDDALDKIPVVGRGLSAYTRWVNDYINRNVAKDYADPTYYMPKREDVKTIDQFEHVSGKEKHDSSWIGPQYKQSFIDSQLKSPTGIRPQQVPFKSLTPKIQSMVAPLRLLESASQVQEPSNYGWAGGYMPINPVIEIAKTSNPHQALRFPVNKTEQPNANFPTSGFGNSRTRGKREKIYKVVI